MVSTASIKLPGLIFTAGMLILLSISCGKKELAEDEETEDETDSTSTPAAATTSSSGKDSGPTGYFYSIEPSASFVSSNAGRLLAQSFQVEEEVEITKVALYLKTGSQNLDNMYIYFGMGNEADGSEDMPWAASIKSESSEDIGEEGWYTFELSTIGDRIFYPGTYYDIQIGFMEDDNDDKVFSWATNDSSEYTDGAAWIEDAAPSCGVWTQTSEYDFAVRFFSN